MIISAGRDKVREVDKVEEVGTWLDNLIRDARRHGLDDRQLSYLLLTRALELCIHCTAMSALCSDRTSCPTFRAVNSR